MKDITIIIIVSLICATFIGSICGGMYLYNQRCAAAFKAGLCEGILPGKEGTHWIKP